MGARRTREEWSGLVDELEASGASVQRFCAKRRIRVASLKWWRWRLRSDRSSAALARPGVRLLPVDVIDVAPLARPTTLVVAISGSELRVEVGTDVEYVGALVSALRSRC
jgi:hypothetical protein